MLHLNRPLAFIDLETTGLSVSSDRIVEISVLRAMPDGSTLTLTQRINPGIAIPPEVTKIHGISNADVADQPTFKEFAPKLIEFIQNCDFAGYNSGYFDLPLLAEELMRAGQDFDWTDVRMVDVQAIFHKNEPRDLKAAYRFYCHKNLEGAHSAETDIHATYEVLLSQLERYPELKGDVDFLHRYTIRNNQSVDLAGRIVRDAQGREIFSFGKYKGQPVTEVFARDKGYYQWMMEGDFPAYTKKIITRIRLSALNAS